nr:CHAT domain-containing protein [Fodinibius salsisoli]
MAIYKLSLNKYSQDEPGESERLLEEAIVLHQQDGHNDHSFRVKAYHHRGVLAEARADYKKALEWYRKGLKSADSARLPNLQTRLLASIGDVYQSRGNYDRALQQLGKAESYYHRNGVEDKRLLGRIYNSYGVVHQGQGNWETALEYYRQSLEIDQEILPRPHPDLAKGFNNMAITYYYQGDYQRALDHMKNATQVLADFHGENHRLVAAGYNNVGIVYSEMDELDKATDYLKKALAIKKKLLDNGHPDIAIAYQNLGAIHYDMGQYDEAITHYKQAESLYLDHFPEGHPELANTYANLGQAYANKQSYDKALDYYQQDLQINLDKLRADHPFIGDTYTKIGETHGMAGNYEQALKYFRQAADIFIRGSGSEVAAQQLPIEEVLYPTQLVETLQQQARVLQKYADQSGETSPLKQAMQTYLKLTQLVGDLQKSYHRKTSKLQLRKRSAEIYKQGFTTACQLLQKTGNADYKEYAFYFAEKSSGQLLLEQLQHLQARKFAGVPDTLIEQEYELKSRLTTLQEKLKVQAEPSQSTDSLRRRSLEDSLFHSRQALTQHMEQVEQGYPSYYELMYQPLVVRAAEVRRKMLAGNQTMIRYFWGSDDLYAFVLTEEETRLRRLPVDSLLEESIIRYRKQMREVNSVKAFVEESYYLYTQLFDPLRDLIQGNQLTIIPDGPLHHLPFESLVTHAITEDAAERFHELPYLVKDFTISYAPSASYLQVSRATTTDERQRSFLGVAPGFDPDQKAGRQRSYPHSDRPLSPLPLSKREVETLGTLFEEEHSFLTPEGQPALFLEDEATENAFKDIPLTNYRYIHLATHAVVSEEDPGQSAILFSTSEPQDDGVLYTSEIYNLQLDARLVALSACKTGIGSMARGEGMMSLSRAFQYAGAQNLLVSLWDVDDRSSARLMEDFYRHHLQDEGMPLALQRTKRQMIKGVQYAHPKYWAPFIFIGH